MAIGFSLFEKYPELVYGFSERKDGSMKRFADEALYKPNLENRKRFFAGIGIELANLVTADLVHSPRVMPVSNVDGGKVIPETDALVTKERNLFLSITGADCFPVYFYEPNTKTVGMAHVGWKGLVGGIVENTVKTMGDVSERSLDALLVEIGPGIQGCHFQVDSNVVTKFSDYPNALLYDKEENTYLDLDSIIREKLVKNGVPGQNIQSSLLCTFCLADKYFSFRRDKPQYVEAMIAYVGVIK